jgi:hypothetical protein
MGAMNTTLLIDAIVRQTTVLVAQLATTSGNRATLAGTANQVFMSLVTELKRQGLGHKVIADMFGLALRTYHNRIQRLTESRSFAGQSVWEAVLQYVQESGPVTRAQVLARFSRDEPTQVRAVLSDLVGSELLVHTVMPLAPTAYLRPRRPSSSAWRNYCGWRCIGSDQSRAARSPRSCQRAKPKSVTPWSI